MANVIEVAGIVIVCIIGVKSLGAIGSDHDVVERIERSSLILESGKEIQVKDTSAFLEGHAVIISKEYVSNAIGFIPIDGSERSYSVKTGAF